MILNTEKFNIVGKILYYCAALALIVTCVTIVLNIQNAQIDLWNIIRFFLVTHLIAPILLFVMSGKLLTEGYNFKNEAYRLMYIFVAVVFVVFSSYFMYDKKYFYSGLLVISIGIYLYNNYHFATQSYGVLRFADVEMKNIISTITKKHEFRFVFAIHFFAIPILTILNQGRGGTYLSDHISIKTVQSINQSTFVLLFIWLAFICYQNYRNHTFSIKRMTFYFVLYGQCILMLKNNSIFYFGGPSSLRCRNYFIQYFII